MRCFLESHGEFSLATDPVSLLLAVELKKAQAWAY